MVNRGYQNDDADIVDYRLWPLDELLHRGPPVDLSRPYFSALGAAQVFGRFVQTPFPSTLERQLGLPVFNAGMSGAGPSFFLSRPRLLDVVNRGKFAVVNLMSGRSLSNSILKVGLNQGTMTLRSDLARAPRFAEDLYKELLQSESVPELLSLREENRDIYARSMIELLQAIRVPKILFYWSTRDVDYQEGISDIGHFWSAFPHFVNREVIERIKPYAEEYVECVTARGLPQPLRSRKDGSPVILWSEDKFPHVKLRDHNYYYPSPEMNDDAAIALLPACQALTEQANPKRLRKVSATRQVIVHMHIFKNAGSSLDKSLYESFGGRWMALDPPHLHTVLRQEDFLSILRDQPMVTALSTHQARFPLTSIGEFIFHPIVMLRNPLLRAQSIYDYERADWRVSISNSIHTQMAVKLSFAGWIEWCLSLDGFAGPIANYQTRMCSLTLNGGDQTDWERPVTLANYQEANACLSRAHVGIVEDYARSLTKIEVKLRAHFPILILAPHITNGTAVSEEVTVRSIAGIRESLGESLYARFCHANRYDFLLHSRYSL